MGTATRKVLVALSVTGDHAGANGVGCLGGVLVALSVTGDHAGANGVGCLGGVLVALSVTGDHAGANGVGCLDGVPPVRPRPPACARSPGPRVPGRKQPVLHRSGQRSLGHD
jgi:hypothetical protein